MITARIGVIGGGGWLGSAIVEGMLKAGVVTPDGLSLSYRSTRPDRFPGAFWTTDSQALADRSDIVILSVRPQDWPALDIDLSGKLAISVMAGVRLSAIGARHRTRVVRAMPNAAAEVGLSYTPWFAGEGVTQADKAIVRAIFAASGVEDEVFSERELDYLTGLSGSGPAFPALLAAAMVEHAVSFGLPKATAEKAALTLLCGAGRLLERSPQPPGEMVDVFLDYRGTTAAAIEAMRAAGFDQAVASGLQAAFDRAVAMGRP